PAWVSSAIDRVPLYFSIGSALIGWMVLRALDRFRAKMQEARDAEARAKSAAAMDAERFADFAGIAADGFWETDADLRLTYVSASFAQAMGVAPEAMLGSTPEQAYRLRFPDAPGVAGFMAPLLGHREFHDQLLSMQDRKGQGRWLLNQGGPFLDASGNFAGYRGTVRDVTQQRVAERALKKSENRLRLITENTPALIAYVDAEERYRFCNSLVGDVLGVPVASILGRTMREVRGEEAYALLAPHVTSALLGNAVTFEGQGPWYGVHHHFQTSYIPDISASGRGVGFYAVTFDITKVKESELALAVAERRMRLITDNVPALIAYIDADRRFRFNNQVYSDWLRRPLDEITGQRVADVYDAETFAKISPHLEEAFAGKQVTFEVETATRHIRAAYIPDTDAGGHVVGVYGLIHDITQLKQIESELRTLSRFDSLTGLANRRRYNERLAEAIARSERGGTMMALMFLDLDRFKAINDAHGHKGGDLALQEFARRVEACIRRTDTVARLAGDEFVVILESMASAEDADRVARKILDAMTAPMQVESKPCQLSTSIGIAVRRQGEVDGEALLRRADAAMYAAKNAGRRTFQFAQ
ncbi:MAG: diguanylate cyclase domain-containing protein, partial [Arenimonas sp.]